jgi:hypothetical protein
MRNLRGRLQKLERRARPEKCSGIFVVATEADRREAEARREAARAKGQQIVTVTVGGIDLVEGI